MSGMPVIPDRERPGAFIVRVNGTDQSYLDPDPLHLEFDYVQRIAEVIDAWTPAPDRVSCVHVGGGGLTLPRWIATTRPTSAQIVLEPDQELLDDVRAAMPLPSRSGIKVRVTTGQDGLAAMRDAYTDIMIVDAFAGGQVPGELATLQWFAQCARVLAPDGLFIMNATDKTPFTFTRRAAAGLRRHWSSVAAGAEVATWKGRRFGNVVMIASNAALPMSELVRTTSGLAFPYRWQDPSSTQDWIGNLNPYTDNDCEPSPRPLTAFISR